MNYPVTYDEKEMRAYRAGRLYIQNALLDAAQSSGDLEIIKFVLAVLKVHRDVNVEVN